MFPMGYSTDQNRISDGCSFLYSASSSNNFFLTDQAQTAFGEWNTANGGEVFLDSDNRGNPWISSTKSCAALTYNNYDALAFAEYTFVAGNGDPLNPNYPASSQWVTSLGATQLQTSGSVYIEMVASIVNGATITSGGGFSWAFSRPSWQNSVVTNYLATASLPGVTFNNGGRAYPDVSMDGHSYLVYDTTSGGSSCPCEGILLDGTSCSSPSFAGFLALINDELLSEGKSPLGFVTPTLYQMALAKPSSFNDITSGNNCATESYVCQFGFNAAVGWDPVTGLGSPDFGIMYEYIVGHPPPPVDSSVLSSKTSRVSAFWI